jgi:hypothetical protein
MVGCACLAGGGQRWRHGRTCRRRVGRLAATAARRVGGEGGLRSPSSSGDHGLFAPVPAAGVAAARIIQRAPKQIRPTPAPNAGLAKVFTSAAGSSPSRSLGEALAGGFRAAARQRAKGLNAHHIVAVKDSRAEFARMVLASRGIGPNSSANGVWLHRAMHAPIHTNAYYANVNAVMAKYYFGRGARHLSWSATLLRSAGCCRRDSFRCSDG